MYRNDGTSKKTVYRDGESICRLFKSAKAENRLASIGPYQCDAQDKAQWSRQDWFIVANVHQMIDFIGFKKKMMILLFKLFYSFQ